MEYCDVSIAIKIAKNFSKNVTRYSKFNKQLESNNISKEEKTYKILNSFFT
ncbi:5151_t:CDS:2 [Cetraspora pellucida]|uniref:5151_t:CDS:1 n=1 Tax=Cetraspora pellucida TaxID=1433469 RepID=A0A9N9AIT3_9GLOM|nr:5151_t:CDS:2 [Cetraspora pellucida]